MKGSNEASFLEGSTGTVSTRTFNFLIPNLITSLERGFAASLQKSTLGASVFYQGVIQTLA